MRAPTTTSALVSRRVRWRARVSGCHCAPLTSPALSALPAPAGHRRGGGRTSRSDGRRFRSSVDATSTAAARASQWRGWACTVVTWAPPRRWMRWQCRSAAVAPYGGVKNGADCWNDRGRPQAGCLQRGTVARHGGEGVHTPRHTQRIQACTLSHTLPPMQPTPRPPQPRHTHARRHAAAAAHAHQQTHAAAR